MHGIKANRVEIDIAIFAKDLKLHASRGQFQGVGGKTNSVGVTTGGGHGKAHSLLRGSAGQVDSLGTLLAATICGIKDRSIATCRRNIDSINPAVSRFCPDNPIAFS
jgi:hypothetical protein